MPASVQTGEDQRPTWLTATMEFEHRDKDGNLKAKGFQKVDWRRRTHQVHVDPFGCRTFEAVFDEDQNLIQTKGPSVWHRLIYKLIGKGG